MSRPLILVTNDDGIRSKGLWAAAEALLPLGDVEVVAPDRQWSGAGRSMPHDVTGRIQPAPRSIRGQRVVGYALDASPALAVVHAITELLPKMPDLVVSGVNFGTNMSIEVTISGTVGAAMEAAATGIPALAVSLEMAPGLSLVGDDSADYGAAMHYTRFFAQRLLEGSLTPGVTLLNLNIPREATPETPWRLTRLARRRYFVPVAPERRNGRGRPGYVVMRDPQHTEPDSDVHTVIVDRMVSLTPLSLDLTAHLEASSLPWAIPARESALTLEVAAS
jgi:5'-nucleotidase